jgi:hypothetical protein
MMHKPPVGRRDAIQALGSVVALGFLGNCGGYAGAFHVGVGI